MIILENISKAFKTDTGTTEVIRNLSFSFKDGLIYSIEGPSGCGKTTLLKIISGIDKDHTGSVAAPDNISFSFQGSVLLPFTSAKENVKIVMGDKKRTLDEATQILNELGIYDVDKYPEELSGGMKSRVDVARALAYVADLYLFDEPFANLDSESARLCADVIKKRTRGKTVISIIHNNTAVMDFADIHLKCSGEPISELLIK